MSRLESIGQGFSWIGFVYIKITPVFAFEKHYKHEIINIKTNKGGFYLRK
jgi:hypothetical protein